VGDGVAHDVGDVVVGEGVHDFLAATLGAHQVHRPEDPQVLRDEWLLDVERLDEFVDALRSVLEDGDDSQSQAVTEGPEQRGSVLEILGTGVVRSACSAVCPGLVAVLGLVASWG